MSSLDVINFSVESMSCDVVDSGQVYKNITSTERMIADACDLVEGFERQPLEPPIQFCENNKVNVCEKILDCKMANLELSDMCSSSLKAINGDGSDSGVDIGSVSALGGLQRALSNNSAGYASSCGGLEEAIVETVSCDSSMISCCSDVCDNKTVPTILCRNTGNGECGTSEGGSESSSVTGGPISALRKTNINSAKKKVAMTEPINLRTPPSKRLVTLTSPPSSRSRSRTTSAGRANSTPPKPTTITGGPSLATRERARSRESVTTQTKTLPPSPSNKAKRQVKPDSLPSGFKDPASPAIQRITGNSRTPSVTRGRTPGATPTDDGRWPSIGGKSGAITPRNIRGGSATPETLIIKTRVGALTLDNKTTTIDKFATLPRRRKEKSADDLNNCSTRSNSSTREPHLARMTASTMSMSIRKQSSKDVESRTPSKTLPPYLKAKKLIPKTKIYHEISVQTAITSKDVEDAFSGITKNVKIDAIEVATKETQSDIRDKEFERLEEQLKVMTVNYKNSQKSLSEKTIQLSSMEQELLQERNEKLIAQKELQTNADRVLAMIDTVNPTESEDGGGDSLLMLESQIQFSGHVLEKQQNEIKKLQNMCRGLQNDMEKSLSTQKCLIQQRDKIEVESTELQEFLQMEKLTLLEALQETETDLSAQKDKINQKDNDLERLQEECRHLVRISEQRRQEYLGLQSKYSALETRSKELIIQQSGAVSGASVALAGLGTRLDSLVEQLIASYNISEHELEDVVYHNEAYTHSGSSGDGSPEYEHITTKLKTIDEGSLSPQRGHSFIAAVIKAIKNATSTGKHNSVVGINNGCKKDTITVPGEDSDSTEMLDSETEPCLMMENVLEDVTMPDSHSHNLVSTSGMMLSQIEIPSDLVKHDDSFDNLSQAIANRQQIERQTSLMANRSVHNSVLIKQQSMDQSISDDISGHESIADIPSISEYCSAQSLVDQVIEVDNSVTKLLKVLRIIQLDNDNCIQQLIIEKNRLQLNKEETLERLKEWEDIDIRLKDDLRDATQQLTIKSNDLANSKAELLRHRIEIDRLNEDICNLSTLCSQNNAKSASPRTINKDEILKALKIWQENGPLPEPDLITNIFAACSEIPMLREKLTDKERCLNDITGNMSPTRVVMAASWHQVVNEAKRQYEAIDRALETLNSIQTIVEQCPALSQLQRDLEETNFQSAETIPFSTALLHASNETTILAPDFNANAAPTTTTTSTNNVLLNGDNTGNHVIDSTA